jgi:hypothetical protein
VATWTPGDRWDPGNPENRERTRQLQREMRAYVMRWDPIWQGSMPDASDEYDAYISPLLHMLHGGKSAEEIEAYLIDVVENRMGIQCVPGAEHRLAQELVAWWWEKISL